jgi:hypothetical protein
MLLRIDGRRSVATSLVDDDSACLQGADNQVYGRVIMLGNRRGQASVAPIYRQPRRRGPSMDTLCLGLMIIAGVAAPSNVLSFPPPEDVIDRVLAAARHVDLTSVTMVINFRIGRPATAPPACVFQGVLHVSPYRTELVLTQWTPNLLCWTIERYVLRRLFEDRDHVDTLLPSFRFEVTGEKFVDGHPYYLVYGRALTPKNDPQWMIGWVDYDRGLVVDGTIRYAWGEVNCVQEYGVVAGVWVLVHQDLDVPRFHASLEISYSGFHFLSHP